MLLDEIKNAQRLVRTDAYQMSIGEIANMYENEEIVIAPEFQRLFRWEIGQKSKFIESILLGIPLPPIFVFERANGKWEIIDGLQRTSTILEFMGRLRDEAGGRKAPSVLEATKYLPSLHNAVWEHSSEITAVAANDQIPLDKSAQLSIRRARIGVEILKRPSDEETKFDLFQRLNAGGTQANAQELRNCIMIMVRPRYFQAIKWAAKNHSFRNVLKFSKEQIKQQRHMEYAVRFLVHTSVPYNGKLDVEEYIDEGVITLAKAGDLEGAMRLIHETFTLLDEVAGSNALRRLERGKHSGIRGLVGLEAIAVGIAKNLNSITQKSDPVAFLKARIEAFWIEPEVKNFTSRGLRGTTRIQRTVPFGEHWFSV